MILYIEKVVKNSDNIIIEESGYKIIYEKIYNKENNLSIRVVIEIVENRYEIKSLHYIKIKKPP